MTTNYPNGYDSYPVYVAGTPDPAGKVTDIADAVEAIEAELGLNPSGGSATVADRLNTAFGTNVMLYIDHTGSSWPLRSTVTSDLTRRVEWFGPASDPPPTGGGYAVVGRDVFRAIG